MKSPGTEGTPPLDVSIEELKAWLERARQEPLREDGYQKLLAAIRTLHYVTSCWRRRKRPWRRCVSCCALPARRKPERY